jgi:hypothetical protein
MTDKDEGNLKTTTITTIIITMALVGILSISTMMVNANASHSSSPAACEGPAIRSLLPE